MIACSAGRGRLGGAATNQDNASKCAHQGQQADAKHDGGQNAVLALGKKLLSKVVDVKEWLFSAHDGAKNQWRGLDE